MNRKLLLPAALVVVAVIAGVVWTLSAGTAEEDPNTLTLYGNVDIRQVSLAFNASERIAELRVREGDVVQAGQVLGLLDTRSARLRLAQAQAQIDAQGQVLLRLKSGSRPEQAIAAKLAYIASVAEFTPKTVQTPELRTSLVYEVRFLVKDARRSIVALAGVAVRAVEPRLEDGFMALLHQDEPQASAVAQIAAEPSSLPVPVPGTGNGADTVIAVENVVRKFGDFTAVANTSFSVRRGEVFGLLGPNGAGKTTTFRMLCGLLPATSGSLRVAGVDLRTARAAARRRVGYVSQRFALYGNLNVLENLQFFAGAWPAHAGLSQGWHRALS